MKKYIGLFAILALSLTVNIQALRAEDGTTSTDSGLKIKNELKDGFRDIRAGVKDQIQSIREKAKENMQKLKDEIKSEKDTGKAKLKELRIAGREIALTRFDAAVARIGGLEERINLIIDNLEAKDVDVSAAKDLVDTADSKLTDAKAKIAEINALLASSVNELTPADKTKLRTLAQDTQKLIVAAHLSLRDAVKSLKDAVKAKLGESENNSSDENKSGDEGNND